MSISHHTCCELELCLHYLTQELVFGLTIDFSEEVKPLLSIPIEELNEEQARSIINDAIRQLHEFLDKGGMKSDGDEGYKKDDSPAQC